MAQISIINLSKLGGASRLDAEYYKPEYLKIEDGIKENHLNFTTFEKLHLKVDASAFYPALEPLYGSGNLPFLRVEDVDTTIHYDGAETIPEEILEKFKTLKVVKEGDLVITKGGSVARVGLVTKKAAVCRDIIFINSSKLDRVDYTYLFFYFLTDFANKLLIRSSSLTAQPHLTITLVREIPIFNPKKQFKQEISDMYQSVTHEYEKSRQFYQQAEQLLLDELEFNRLNLKHELVYTVNFSETLKHMRIDAEYYLPHYKEISKAIENYGSAKLQTIIQIKDNNFIPKTGHRYRYIELSNISKEGFITDFTLEVGENLPSRARRLVKTGDVIISSIEGSLSSCALITKEYDDSLCSTGFYVLRSAKINPETLLVMFKLKEYQELLKKGCSGTILTAINKDELESIMVPIIDKDIQDKIAAKVRDAHESRTKAKQLLEEAKRKVEKAIEEKVG
ncbi:MAG: restriction endonuclease subunit S [Candidatus Micrarchaeota archaeon]|nr:restriction endonuclease subunit S [Candidatus Micrarchaeota archaeon]